MQFSERVEPTMSTEERALMAGAVRTVLDSRSQLILWRFYGEGQTLDEVGEELGVSRQRVMQLRDTALDRLREALEL